MSTQAKQDVSSLPIHEAHNWNAAPLERERWPGDGAMVVPLARSLAILEAFSPQEPWLGNQEFAHETGIPTPTVSRMLRSLVALGYLRYSPEHRKYRLAMPVRIYLLGNVERKAGRHWSHLRRRIGEGISQVHNVGFCESLGQWEPDLTILAAPLINQDHTPLVLACIGRSAKLGRARVERDLGPRLVAAARRLQEQAALVD